MKLINFSKMVATGNDFIVIDNRRRIFRSGLPGLAKKLCERKFGIGADGLLLAENSKKADFKMRIFNPDGSEPDMCGNGSRCIAFYAKAGKIAAGCMKIDTKAGLLSAKINRNNVKINMTEPKDLKESFDLKVGKKNYKLHYINTGVPHVVWFTDDIENVDMVALGGSIRYHKLFAPYGTNFNAVCLKGNNSILIRTYERGVEAETLACGTGSVASSVLSGIVKGFKSPVKVQTKGGRLNIYFKIKGSSASDVFLEGEVKEVFKGRIEV